MRYRYDIHHGVQKLKTKSTLIIQGVGLSLIGVTMAVAMPLGAKALATCVVSSGPYPTIQSAVSDPTCTTINVAPGTYTETGPIVINRDLTIVGANKNNTIIKPAQNTGDPNSGDSRGWFLVNPGVTFNLSNVTLDGSNMLVAIGILSHGNGTIENNVIKNIGYNPSTDYYGRGIQLYNANMTVQDNTLQNIGRIGIFGYGSGVTDATIEGNNYTGKGTGNWLDYGIELGAGAVATISNNTITNNIGVASIDNSTSAGILVSTYFDPGTQATISGNTLTNNTDGIVVGYDASDTSVVVAHLNNISGNSASGVTSTHSAVDATCNWWGSASGPFNNAGNLSGTGNAAIGNVTFSPWLVTSDLNGNCVGGTRVINKDDCKNGGWQGRTDGSKPFKNQGLCVSWVEHNVLDHGTPAANKPSH